MNLHSLCQRCAGDKNHNWNASQAEFHVGAIKNWKVQLCRTCMDHVEQAVLKALKPGPPPEAR